MSDNNKMWIVVPAAGKGSRMGSDLPKQYMPLNNRAIIEHTLQHLLAIDCIEKIIVALHPEDRYWATLGIGNNARIETVVGGGERSDSVLNALKHIKEKAKDDDWVLVHDAARPCVTPENIRKLIERLQSHPVGGILAIPVSDTLKSVDDNQVINNTVDRKSLWQAQTPQMFRFGVLLHALEQSMASPRKVTDEASAVELIGKQALVVEGRRDNIKITHPDDLALAELILKSKNL